MTKGEVRKGKEISGTHLAEAFKTIKEAEADISPEDIRRAEKIKEILQPVIDKWGKQES